MRTCTECANTILLGDDLENSFITLNYTLSGINTCVIYCIKCFCEMAGESFFNKNLKEPIMKEVESNRQLNDIRKKLTDKILKEKYSKTYVQDLKSVMINEFYNK